MTIRLKRVYETPSAEDGVRILVDRLWPRGLSRDLAAVDEWFKDVAPSHELRRWFAHDPAKWPAFQARYRRELVAEPGKSQLAQLVRLAHTQTVTLVYAAKDAQHNNAVVLSALIGS